ncbi:MAG TPA: ATP-dependent DNA ligase [Verrucomicrobiae bacterium]|nr:ATP-dependent DNA ligase [Verrucomicrobiae bacterium]
MKRFTQLFCELDQSTRTGDKVAALSRYFSEVAPADAAWALHFLSGRTLPRVVGNKQLWQWMTGESNLPEWLIAECYDAVGDMAETIALLLPNAGSGGTQLTLSELVEQRLLPLRNLPDNAKRALLLQTWRELNSNERLVWNKIITGNFRIGAARTLVIRALAEVANIDPAIMAHRVMGKWQPTPEGFRDLLSNDARATAIAMPYPFFLASPLEMKIERGGPLDELGDIHDWQVEWKWDGIRAQLIRRSGETLIWSRGDEMITDSFPEIVEAGDALPDGTVLDGEILAWRGDSPLPFASLQRRLGRKSVAAKTRESFPVAFVAYDLLEMNGRDLRATPLTERRRELEKIVSTYFQEIQQRPAVTAKDAHTPLLPGWESHPQLQTSVFNQQTLRVSPLVKADSWTSLAEIQNQSRAKGVEGLMLKKVSSTYGVGRQRGDWWKWKIDPFVIDAVLVAAERGHGRRASLYTDYTFGLWENGQLVPVAKAYSGLTDEEILKVDSFVRTNTTGKFGPVRSVEPLQVFELAFEGIQESTRHKSGVAVRFPRINRWRHDKKPQDADTLEQLLALAKKGGAES